MLTRMRRTRWVRCGVTPILVVSVSSGCTKWTPVQIGPDLPDPVRVTYRAGPSDTLCGQRAELRSATVVGDSLVSPTVLTPAGYRTSISTTELCYLERKSFDPARSGVAVLTGFAVFAAIVAVGLATWLDDY